MRPDDGGRGFGLVPLRSDTVFLTGEDLSIGDVVRVARRRSRVEVSPAALERVRRARKVVDRVLEREDLVCGARTRGWVRSRASECRSRTWSSSQPSS
jgi:hypothetical protein